ncbi:hypothetical protein BGW80DRAFT_1255837 [Lactifluus volemus]|nr:hypothetical protein BGW80DRAFT_1255837 [Lactifluus volemus]
MPPKRRQLEPDGVQTPQDYDGIRTRASSKNVRPAVNAGLVATPRAPKGQAQAKKVAKAQEKARKKQAAADAMARLAEMEEQAAAEYALDTTPHLQPPTNKTAHDKAPATPVTPYPATMSVPEPEDWFPSTEQSATDEEVAMADESTADEISDIGTTKRIKARKRGIREGIEHIKQAARVDVDDYNIDEVATPLVRLSEKRSRVSGDGGRTSKKTKSVPMEPQPEESEMRREVAQRASRDGPTESDRLSEWFKKTNTSALGGGLVAKNTRLPSLGHSSHASSALHPSTATTSGRSAIQAIVHVKPTSNYGGISDPDERVGPEQARARASPAKGKRRLNSDAIVQVKNDKQSIRGGLTKAEKKNDPLLSDPRWKKRFMPTLYLWAGCQDDCWSLGGTKMNTIQMKRVKPTAKVNLNETKSQASIPWTTLPPNICRLSHCSPGSDIIPDITDNGRPYAAIVLAAVAALEEAHGDPKSKDFKPMISGTTLVESNKYVFFSMVNWGGESKRFREGMSGLTGKDFEDIVEKARPILRTHVV